MKSQWEVTYIGSHTSIFIKKFERYLKVKSEKVIKERYELGGKSFERVVFKIEHSSSHWNELTSEVLKMAGRISPEWKLLIHEAGSYIQGVIDVDEREEKGGFLVEGPSGLTNVSWEIKLNQDYPIMKFSGDSTI